MASGTPQDILGIGQVKVFKPYQIEDGWTVVTPGAESGRRQAAGKTVVALSRVEIQLRSQKDLETCIKHLEESDRRFAMIRSNPWDWAKVIQKGLVVRFAVEWYDLKFFQSKKDAYTKPDHAKMYEQFGVTLNEVNVKHFLVDASGGETPA
jgi:hypothetical protein